MATQGQEGHHVTSGPKKKICHREWWSCGQTRDITNKEACPAYGKECKRCHKKHHFTLRCWSKGPGSQRVQAVEIEG